MSGAAATIDGRAIEPNAGETILGAARRLGIDVPALCHVDGLEPEGGCRLCLVEIEGRGGVHASCCTALDRGMSVRTATDRLAHLRRDVLSLIVWRHGDAGFIAGERGTQFERLMARVGVDEPLTRGSPAVSVAAPIDDSHPYMRFRRELCITCRRCVAACEQIQGQFVYAIEGRAERQRLIFGPSERFTDSPCTACGACVDVCPTGAITDRDRLDPETGAAPVSRARETGSDPVSRTLSTCAYCGVGCRVEIETRDDRVLRIRGVRDAEVNRGHLCAKGRFAHAWHESSDRLVEPLVRRGGDLVPISWSEAIDLAAKRFLAIREAHGAGAVGVMTSSRSTNEAAYLFQRLFRTRLGTNNVDCCARVCHSSTALAISMTTGAGAASASYADIDLARSIVVAGANPTEAHPVVGARLEQAALRGAKLVVIDPRRTDLAAIADVHLALRPGTNVALFNAIAKIMIERGAIDRAYIAARTEGLDALEAFLRSQPLDDAARITGVAAARIEEAAELIGGADPALFVSGLGLSETVQGTASVIALSNLAMLTGSVGKRGSGLLPLRGQNNVQGNADMGGMPDMVTGYQRVGDDAVRARLTEIWGAAPPREPGLTLHEMLDAARRGTMRALWIQGEDVAQSDPDQTRVIEALDALDCLVVQELFLSETALHAHLVLPAAGALEQEGTFTNGERRIQHVRAAASPPGEARADWAIVRDVASAMGERWTFETPSDIFDEIARVAPAIFGGVRYDRLEPNGLQWPCPRIDHPGTRTLHERGFFGRDGGRAKLLAVEWAPSPEHGVAGYPYLLITGRVLHQYNVGTMTRRAPGDALAPEDLLEIHPEDAEKERIADGARVGVESRWGSTVVTAHRTRRVAPRMLFLSFHHPETHANVLVGPHFDPQSKCPEYKVTAVRIRAG